MVFNLIPLAENLIEGELYWVDYKESFQLAKLIKIKDEDDSYGVNLVTLQKVSLKISLKIPFNYVG